MKTANSSGHKMKYLEFDNFWFEYKGKSLTGRDLVMFSLGWICSAAVTIILLGFIE